MAGFSDKQGFTVIYRNLLHGALRQQVNIRQPQQIVQAIDGLQIKKSHIGQTRAALHQIGLACTASAKHELNVRPIRQQGPLRNYSETKR